MLTINYHIFWLGNGFLHMTSKTGAIKWKIIELTFIKSKIIFVSKDLIRKLKKWKIKIFVKYYMW
jgi:hypothetical protein